MPKSFIYSVRNYCNRIVSQEKDADAESCCAALSRSMTSKILTRSGKQALGLNGGPNAFPRHPEVHHTHPVRPCRLASTKDNKGRHHRGLDSKNNKSFHHLSLVTRFQLGVRMSRLGCVRPGRKVAPRSGRHDDQEKNIADPCNLDSGARGHQGEYSPGFLKKDFTPGFQTMQVKKELGESRMMDDLDVVEKSEFKSSTSSTIVRTNDVTVTPEATADPGLTSSVWPPRRLEPFSKTDRDDKHGYRDKAMSRNDVMTPDVVDVKEEVMDDDQYGGTAKPDIPGRWTDALGWPVRDTADQQRWSKMAENENSYSKMATDGNYSKMAANGNYAETRPNIPTFLSTPEQPYTATSASSFGIKRERIQRCEDVVPTCPRPRVIIALPRTKPSDNLHATVGLDVVGQASSDRYDKMPAAISTHTSDTSCSPQSDHFDPDIGSRSRKMASMATHYTTSRLVDQLRPIYTSHESPRDLLRSSTGSGSALATNRHVFVLVTPKMATHANVYPPLISTNPGGAENRDDYNLVNLLGNMHGAAPKSRAQELNARMRRLAERPHYADKAMINNNVLDHCATKATPSESPSTDHFPMSPSDFNPMHFLPAEYLGNGRYTNQPNPLNHHHQHEIRSSIGQHRHHSASTEHSRNSLTRNSNSNETEKWSGRAFGNPFLQSPSHGGRDFQRRVEESCIGNQYRPDYNTSKLLPLLTTAIPTQNQQPGFWYQSEASRSYGSAEDTANIPGSFHQQLKAAIAAAPVKPPTITTTTTATHPDHAAPSWKLPGGREESADDYFKLGRGHTHNSGVSPLMTPFQMFAHAHTPNHNTNRSATLTSQAKPGYALADPRGTRYSNGSDGAASFATTREDGLYVGSGCGDEDTVANDMGSFVLNHSSSPQENKILHANRWWQTGAVRGHSSDGLGRNKQMASFIPKTTTTMNYADKSETTIVSNRFYQEVKEHDQTSATSMQPRLLADRTDRGPPPLSTDKPAYFLQSSSLGNASRPHTTMPNSCHETGVFGWLPVKLRGGSSRRPEHRASSATYDNNTSTTAYYKQLFSNSHTLAPRQCNPVGDLLTGDEKSSKTYSFDHECLSSLSTRSLPTTTTTKPRDAMIATEDDDTAHSSSSRFERVSTTPSPASRMHKHGLHATSAPWYSDFSRTARSSPSMTLTPSWHDADKTRSSISLDADRDIDSGMRHFATPAADLLSSVARAPLPHSYNSTISSHADRKLGIIPERAAVCFGDSFGGGRGEGGGRGGEVFASPVNARMSTISDMMKVHHSSSGTTVFRPSPLVADAGNCSIGSGGTLGHHGGALLSYGDGNSFPPPPPSRLSSPPPSRLDNVKDTEAQRRQDYSEMMTTSFYDRRALHSTTRRMYHHHDLELENTNSHTGKNRTSAFDTTSRTGHEISSPRRDLYNRLTETTAQPFVSSILSQQAPLRPDTEPTTVTNYTPESFLKSVMQVDNTSLAHRRPSHTTHDSNPADSQSSGVGAYPPLIGTAPSASRGRDVTNVGELATASSSSSSGINSGGSLWSSILADHHDNGVGDNKHCMSALGAILHSRGGKVATTPSTRSSSSSLPLSVQIATLISSNFKTSNTCPVCRRSFTRSWLLKGHLRTHTGERPFQCTFPACDKAFADKSNLRSHMQIHTSSNKNFFCKRCGRGFSQKRYLHKHAMEVCRT